MILQRIRTWVIQSPFGLFVATVFLFASCSRSQAAHASALSQLHVSSNQITGENLFRAVFFIDGPLAPALQDYQEYSLASLSGGNANAVSAAKEMQNKVIAYLNTADPAYFASFKASVTSGNYATVKAVLTDGASRYLSALQALTGKDLSSIQPENLAAEFQKQYGDLSQYSKAEIAKKVREFAAQKAGTGKKVNTGLVASSNTVYYHNYFWVYIAAAAAVAAILFAFLGEAPAPKGPSPIGHLVKGTDNYLKEDYISTITVNLAK
jgi:hypothetical protein